MMYQTLPLLLLALGVACVTWTVTHEELLREPREWLQGRSAAASSWWMRKFYYMWTCEYCVSHYVAAAAVVVMDLPILVPDWRGYVVSWLALVAIANVCMSLFAHLRVETAKERTERQRNEKADKETGSRLTLHSQ
jgi:hypothetical protein